MANSITDICNAALGRIGGGRLEDFETDDSEAARRCRDNWPFVRDAVLRAGYWNCATVRALLAAGEAPAWGYSFGFPLPAGADAAQPFCLRVVEIEGERDPRAWAGKWKVEHPRRILGNQAGPLKILYIARIENVAFYDASLTDCLAQRLAAVLGYPVTANQNVERFKWEVYGGMLREAKQIDAQEGLPDAFGPDPSEVDDLGWLESRR